MLAHTYLRVKVRFGMLPLERRLVSIKRVLLLIPIAAGYHPGLR